MKNKKFMWPVVGLVVMTILTTIQAATSDGSPIDSQEWVQVALQAVMAFNVWATANLPQYEKMKTYVAIAIAVLQGLVTFVIGGVDTPEIINLVITALAAAGVALTPQRVTTVVDGRTVPPGGVAG
jgi:hypothetical protein